ncbi:uncharacterized protein LOC136081958 [Hydra vulgaris]|uniref:Uncharacterized protein LOC136081958 n=1 Tax=Hydra vulgaris TaxID=6087 RepID=A0ABM4C4J5_HYDVU
MFLQDESQMDLARAVYGTGCSLRVFENKLWIDSFAKLRPAFKLPNRDMLSNSLLERVYNETSTTVKELVGTALSVASLCDGWNNIRNDGIINFVVTVPQPIFWTSIEIGAESHTGEYMANIVKKIICDVGPMKVLGVCTDNAANMKKAWQLIVTEFPHIYPYGCLAHTLNLIFTDASNLKSIADSQRNCTMVVKGIKNSQILSALLKQHQQKSGQIIQQSLKLPVTTRWASIIHCMESLHNNRLALRGLAIDDEAKSLAKPIQNLLLSEVFWDKVDGFIKLLKPIAIAIAAVEGDKLSLSIIAKTFSDLEKSFQDNILCSPILKNEENAMMEIIAKRRKFHIRNIHLAANLVDPCYKGCHISGDEMIDAIETLHKLGKMDSSIKECDDKILGEIADYRSNEEYVIKGIYNMREMKHLLRLTVKDTFGNGNLPPSNSRRFYPNTATIRSHIVKIEDKLQ